jgi:hypothetical protein
MRGREDTGEKEVRASVVDLVTSALLPPSGYVKVVEEKE